MKKIVRSLLTLVLLLIGFLFMNVDGNTVLAAETEYKTELVTLSELGESKIPVCSDTTEEWLFAGWYEDAACEVAYRSFPTSETAYAKFVPEKVLSVKLQLTKGTDGDSKNTNMRLVSSVDSLDYRKVGFKVYFKDASEPVNIETTKVYERIVASEESGVDYNYSPKVVNTKSEYFVTATLINISQGNFKESFYIRPYWVTLDGTEVYGENRYVTVEDGYDTTIINMPVKMSSNPGDSLTVSGVSDATVSLANYDGTYAHIRIKLADRKALDSATKIEVTSGDSVVGSDVYRNLLTTHESGDEANPNADTSWYEVYKDDTSVNEYYIATSADLYGLAKIVNGTATDSTGAAMQSNFLDKTVYVVADLEMNKGEASRSSLTWVADSNGAQTTYAWTQIGTSTAQLFQGNFDGQMHTISGVYLSGSTANDTGMFRWVDSNTTICNLKLINSFVKVGNYQRTGGIVGEALGGKIDSVYSDAIVVGTQHYVGGFVGRAKGLEMNNCWYAGYVRQAHNTAARYGTGGLIGGVSSGYTVTLRNCLNTGTVSANKLSDSTMGVGGLVGYVAGTLNSTNCLSAGTLHHPNLTAGYGPIIGVNSAGTITLNNTYATAESNTGDSTFDATVSVLDVTTILGTDALTADTKNLFSYIIDETIYENESYWAVVPGEAPVLSDFAETAGIENYQAIDTSWYNKNETDFILTDAADFYGLTMLSRVATVEGFVDKNIILGADIVIPNEGEAADWATTAPKYEWTSIGASGLSFNGTFDGQGKEISGVYMNVTEAYNGLFSYVGCDATIQNFNLKNSYFHSTMDNFASIAGRTYGGVFDTIYSDAIVVTSANNAGGLIGRVQGSSEQQAVLEVKNCWFAGAITNTASDKVSTGGLVGRIFSQTNYVDSVSIINCLNSGTVSAENNSTPYIGGIYGYNQNGNATVANSLNVGKIVYKASDDTTTTTQYGLIGSGTLGSVSNTYTIAQEGVDYRYGSANADYTLDKTTIYGTAAMNEMPELFAPALVDGKYVTYWITVPGSTPVLSPFVKYASEDAFVPDTTWYNADKSSYTLNDVADFYGFALLSKLTAIDGFAGKKIILGTDIDVNEGWTASATAPEYKWIGIGYYLSDDVDNIPFKGEFDGNNKTIKGIYYNNTETKYGGLFRLVEGATIKNFSLTNSYIASNRDFMGSIAGQATDSSFEQIYSNAVVVGSRNSIGGLVGRISTGDTSTSMVRCWYDGAVTNNGNSTSNRNTGGLVGRVNTDTTISNCLNTADVSAPNYAVTEKTDGTDNSVRPYIGGLVGFHSAGTMNLSYSLNTGKISFNEVATIGYGAVVGRVNNSLTVNALAAYGTTSSCSTAVSITTSNTVKPTITELELVNIVDAALMGDAAEDTKLFATENAGAWSVVDNAYPVLTCFADKATSGSAPTLTNTQTTVQENAGTVIAETVDSSVVTFTDKDTVVRRQGGCYVVRDGKAYYYQSFIKEYYGDTASQLLGKNNLDNKVIIVKYDYDTREEIARSEELALCHTNDMTYNSKLDLLVVAHANDDMHRVSFIDPDTLERVDGKYVDGLSYYNIDYNSTYDCYVVLTGAENGKGHGIAILNGNMEIIARYESDGLYTDPKKVDASGAQGVGCDDKYIYCLFSNTDTYTHAITVFDWNGNYVTEISFALNEEPESLSLVGNQILINVAGESKIYSITF